MNNTIVARLGGGPGEPGWLDCYPWPADEAALVEAFHHKPYRRSFVLYNDCVKVSLLLLAFSFAYPL